MAYEDWPAEFQDLYDNTPGVQQAYDYPDEFDPDLTARLEEEFEQGFMQHAESSSYGWRDEFFEELNIDEDMFNWAEWREAMGYD